MQDVRYEPREPKSGGYALTWKGKDGVAYSAEGRGVNISKSGVGIESSRELRPGSIIYVQAQDGSIEGECEVVHCTRRGAKYLIGFEFREDEGDPHTHAQGNGAPRAEAETDYYDILQISPKADMQTIHRVFRMMAARFHPDNPETGDVEEFLRMKKAYAVLSDPERRQEYDAMRESRERSPMPVFELRDFVTGVDAEANRRLGVLSLLYNQRKLSQDHPGVSLLDLEERMGFPREYLNFTLWYLRAKEFVTAEDNSDYSLTAAGADYVEKKAARNEIVFKLLKPGGPRVFTGSRPGVRKRHPAKPQFLLGTPAKDGTGPTR